LVSPASLLKPADPCGDEEGNAWTIRYAGKGQVPGNDHHQTDIKTKEASTAFCSDMEERLMKCL
jgi:hypothetical protein